MMTRRNQVNMSRRSMLAVCGMLLAGGFLFGHAWQSAKVGTAYHEVTSLTIQKQLAARVADIDDSVTPNLVAVSTTITDTFKEKGDPPADRVKTALVVLDAGRTQIKAFQVELQLIEKEAESKLDGDFLKDALAFLQGARRRLDLVEMTYQQFEEELTTHPSVVRLPGPVLRRDKQLEAATKKAFERITEALDRMSQEQMQKGNPAQPKPK